MTLDEKNHFLRTLSENEFRRLGDAAVVYIREIEFQGKVHYAVTGADGNALSLAPNLDVALNAIQSGELEAVTLH